MKNFNLPARFHSRRGFTLVELLVVMGIIAILAAVSAGVGLSVLKQARKASAANTAQQIQTACLNYYTEYSVYPVDPAAAGTDSSINDTDDAKWGILIQALAGNINPVTGATVAPTTVTNSRGIAFLNMKASDLYSAAKVAPKNPLPPDANHLYFNIAFDSNYDGVIGSDGKVNMPNFVNFDPNTGGTSTAGIALWANCKGDAAAPTASNFIHTY